MKNRNHTKQVTLKLNRKQQSTFVLRSSLNIQTRKSENNEKKYETLLVVHSTAKSLNTDEH